MTTDFSDQEFDFTPGSVRGVRTWQTNIPNDLYLRGLYNGKWATSYLEANCASACKCDCCAHGEKKGHESDLIPYIKCRCGIYAYWDYDQYEATTYAISGVIEGFGRTLIGTKGFRSQKARIVAFNVHDGWPFINDDMTSARMQATGVLDIYKKQLREILFKMLKDQFPEVPVFDTFEAMRAAVELTSDYANHPLVKNTAS